MSEQVFYWQVPMEEWDFPVRVAVRTNNAEDIDLYDWSVHWHEQLEFQYVLQGGMGIYCNGQTEWLYPGDVFFANWCDPHCATGFLDNTRYYVVQLDLQWLVPEYDPRLSKYADHLMMRAQAVERFIRQDDVLCDMLRRIVEENDRRRIGYEMNIKALGLAIVAHLLRSCPLETNVVTPHDETIKYTREVLYYLSHHYAQTLNLDDLAKEIGLNKYYVCRIFKRHTGCTVVQYLNKLRCYMALSVIANGASASAAAETVGFSDYNYFSRTFKKLMGCRPSEVAQKGKDPFASSFTNACVKQNGKIEPCGGGG